MFSFLTEIRDAQKLAGQKFNVIFFAENGYYFQYFQHLYEELVQVPGIKIAYITSDKKDKVLADERVQSFYLKNTLAGIFPRLQADVMIMTMPDLQNYIFKKSTAVKQYVYVFHALVSTHQQYNIHAFDHYDVIFCTGPQQEKEIREAEKLYSLPAKNCISYGYPFLGLLKKKVKESCINEKKILIAPSWYKEGILNTCILPLVKELTKAKNEVWIRPHPEFIKRNKKAYEQLVTKVQENELVHFDTSPSVYTHLLDAAYLISDRSGIAIEFALATYRPVLFIDTPLKIQNPEVERLTIEPLENAFRSSLGASISPNELHRVNEVLQQIKSSAENYRTFIQAVENKIVFSPANWQMGVSYIRNQLLL